MGLWLPSVPHDPTPYPTGIWMAPSGPLGHRTIGSWPGDYSVLTRGLVPSVHLLIGQDEGEWVQFMAADMVAYGAAGANMRKVHFEFSGQNGEPLTDWQWRAGVVCLRELYDAFGWDPSVPYYEGGPAVEERIWIDVNDPVVGLNHAGVDYPPNRSFNHYDFVPEMPAMIASIFAAPVPPEPEPIPVPVPPPPPDPNAGDDDMGLKKFEWKDDQGVEHVDYIGVAEDGSVFTMEGFGGHNYYISGPRSTPDATRPRTSEPSRVDQVPTAVEVDGQLRFRTIAQGGPEGPGTGVIEHYWLGTDPDGSPGADGSRWGSYAVVSW